MNNDTNDTITELARQNVMLKTFVRTIIKENCFGYDGEVDGLDVQDQAANCGIILPETVTREMVEEWERTQTRPDDFDEGDTIYNFAPWMTGDAEQMQNNQSECDHIGLIDKNGGHVFSIGELFYRIHIGEIDDEYIDDEYEKFKHCPKCGAKIDWQKIEENLNANNS